MSIRSVKREIKNALADKVLTGDEAANIIAVAQKGPLTTGETKAISDLYDRGVFKFPTHFPQGALVQPRPPEFDMESAASTTLMNFFLEERVPQGKMYGEVKEDIEVAKRDLDWAAIKLDEPPHTKHLHHVHLRDMRPVDGSVEDAFVDTRKDEFYLRVQGAGMGGPIGIGPSWYGPIDLKPLSAVDRIKERLDDVRGLASEVGLPYDRTYTPEVQDVEANDDGTFTVTLAAVNWRDPNDISAVKKAIVDENADFVSVVVVSPDEVKDQIDAWGLAAAIGLNTNRSFTPRVASVKERADGYFDVTLEAVHFMRGDVTDRRRAVVDGTGQYMKSVVPTLTDESVTRIRDAYQGQLGNLDFTDQMPPAGERYERRLIEALPNTDSTRISVLIPVGEDVPGAKAKDPNEVGEVYLERSGFTAGTSWAKLDLSCLD